MVENTCLKILIFKQDILTKNSFAFENENEVLIQIYELRII